MVNRFYKVLRSSIKITVIIQQRFSQLFLKCDPQNKTQYNIPSKENTLLIL